MSTTGGLSLTLNNALSGLNVNQQALSVLSQNIANANTPGYSRQVVNQSAVYLDGQGEGVDITSVTRQVDQYLVQAVQQQNTSVGGAGAVNDYNNRIQLLLGQPGANNSIDTYIDNYFNAVQSLAQTASDPTLQQAVVNSGVTLATQVQTLATGLQNLQYQADGDINTSITSVNNDLKTLAQLNSSISSNTALGNSVADLQDQRDTTLNDLAQYLNIQTYTNNDGSINVTCNGVSLLTDSSTFQLSYNSAASAASFGNSTPLGAIDVYRIDADGNQTGQPVQLVSGGPPSQITSQITGGKIAGLLTVRDQEVPDIMNQLDLLASNLRDQVNTIQNAGTGYPGASSLTGTREVNAADYNTWSGSVQIAVLNQSGQPVPSPYADEPNGMPPLTLNLADMNTGQGTGNPSVQGIINAINQYYGVPQNKAELGNLNNIQLVAASSALPNASSQFSFGFNLNNISATPSNFYVTGVQVQNEDGTTMTPVTSTLPSVALASTNTYVTTAGSNVVTVNTQPGTNNNLVNGETVYLSIPTSPPASSSTVNGIPLGQLGGFFTVSNVTPTSFDIQAASVANTGVQAEADVSGQTALPPYAQALAGQTANTIANGTLTASLPDTSSPYYDVTVNVATDDGNGNISTGQVTYRVSNNQTGILNTQYSALSAGGDATLVQPTSKQPVAVASLVDANGNPLPQINGQYTTLQNGYLKIAAGNSSYTIAINSLDSAEEGQPNSVPPTAGSGWGFSHYFDLNDFFQSNQPSATGDTVAGSALNLQVEQRFQNDPGLLSTGTLAQSSQSTDPNAPPNYTYQVNTGDNSVIAQLSNLGNALLPFNATGGLGASTQTLGGYAEQIIGTASANAATATTNSTNAQTLLTGYQQQASTISGVNLDTELANTVIYQNAYSATARVITVVQTLFDTLLSAFTGT